MLDCMVIALLWSFEFAAEYICCYGLIWQPNSAKVVILSELELMISAVGIFLNKTWTENWETWKLEFEICENKDGNVEKG